MPRAYVKKNIKKIKFRGRDNSIYYHKKLILLDVKKFEV